MRDTDIHEFTAMLCQVANVLTRGQYKPDAPATALWFRALAALELEQVRAAFDAHVHDPDRGRFFPTPADIIGKARLRPKADEAWAIAVKSADESASVTWNDEIAEAWGIALPVWHAGDEVGARMAFKDAYERITRDKQGAPVKWWASLGHDPSKREAEVKQSVAAGLLTHEAALMLQAPDSGTMNRLVSQAPPHVREALLKLREKLAAKPGGEVYEPNPDIARTADLKQQAQDLTDAYQREQA